MFGKPRGPFDYTPDEYVRTKAEVLIMAFSVEDILLGDTGQPTTPEKAAAMAGALKRQKNYGLLGQMMNLQPTVNVGRALGDQAQTGLKTAVAQQQANRNRASQKAQQDRQQQNWQQTFDTNAQNREVDRQDMLQQRSRQEALDEEARALNEWTAPQADPVNGGFVQVNKRTGEIRKIASPNAYDPNADPNSLFAGRGLARLTGEERMQTESQLAKTVSALKALDQAENIFDNELAGTCGSGRLALPSEAGRRYDAIANRLTPDVIGLQRVAGEGSQSDFEARIKMLAVPFRVEPGSLIGRSEDQVKQAIIAQRATLRDRADFMAEQLGLPRDRVEKYLEAAAQQNVATDDPSLELSREAQGYLQGGQ